MDSALEDMKVIPIYDCDIFNEEALISNDNLSPLSVPVKEPITITTQKHFPCAHCTDVHVFKSRSGLLRHEKKCHPEVPRRWKKKRTTGESQYKTVKNVICREDNCGFCCYKIGQLRRHLQSQHNFNILPPETLHFDSMTNFEVWKKNHELATQSKFVRRWTRADGAHEFLCNRSGSYRSQSKGFRQPRIAGSLKSGGHCTARIILFNGKSKPDLKNGVQITFYPTHYGHSIYTSMNKRKIMQETKRKQRVLATALATEKKEIHTQLHKARKEAKSISSAVGTATAKMRKKSASNNSDQDYENVIQEIESNLQSIKTMQTKSLEEDTSTDDFKLIFLNPGNTQDLTLHESTSASSASASATTNDTSYQHVDVNLNPTKSEQVAMTMGTFEMVKLEGSWDTSSQTDVTMGNESILPESDMTYGKQRKGAENIDFSANNNCVNSHMGSQSHLEALNMEMDRLYSLKPYLSKISTADDSTRILTLVNFVHDSIVEVLTQNI